MPPHLPDPEDLDDFDDDLLPTEDRADEYANGHRVVPRNRQYNDRRKEAARQGRSAGDQHRRPNRGNKHTLIPGQYKVDKKKKASSIQLALKTHHENMAAHAKRSSAKIEAGEAIITGKPAMPTVTMAEDEAAAFQRPALAQLEEDPIATLVKNFRDLHTNSLKPFISRSKAPAQHRRTIERKPTMDDEDSEPPAFNFALRKPRKKQLPAANKTDPHPKGKTDRNTESSQHFWKDMAPVSHPRARAPSTSSSSASNPYASSSGDEVSFEDVDMRKARNMLDEEEDFLLSIADDVLDTKYSKRQSKITIQEQVEDKKKGDLDHMLMSRIRRTSVGSSSKPKSTITNDQQGQTANEDRSVEGEGENIDGGDDKDDLRQPEIDAISMDDWDLLDEDEEGENDDDDDEDEEEDNGDDLERPEIDELNMDEWDLLEEEVAAWKGDGYDADDEHEIVQSPAGGASTAWPTADNGKGRMSWGRWLGFRSNERAV